MVLGPTDNKDSNSAALVDRVLDIEEDVAANTASTAQEGRSHSIQMGAQLQHIGGLGRNAVEPNVYEELDSIRDLQHDIRNDDKEEASDIRSMPPPQEDTDMLEDGDSQLSMAGTFSSNDYLDRKETPPGLDPKEFGAAKRKKNKHTKSEIMHQDGQSAEFSQRNRSGSLVDAVPIYNSPSLRGQALLLSESPIRSGVDPVQPSTSRVKEKIGHDSMEPSMLTAQDITAESPVDDPSGTLAVPSADIPEHENTNYTSKTRETRAISLSDAPRSSDILEHSGKSLPAEILDIEAEGAPSTSVSSFPRIVPERTDLIEQLGLDAVPRYNATPCEDAGTMINFSEIVQLEGQIAGQYYRSIEEYLKLAIDMAVRDTMKEQVKQGSLIRLLGPVGLSHRNDISDTTYDHPSDKILANTGHVDSTCQCCLAESFNLIDTATIDELAVLECSPASDLQKNDRSADYAVQCELVSNRQKLRSRGSPPKFFAELERTEPPNTSSSGGSSTRPMSNHSTGCSLPHDKPFDGKMDHHPQSLPELVENSVNDSIHRFMKTQRLDFTADIVEEIEHHVQQVVMMSLGLIHAANGGASEQQLIHWVKSVNFLQTLERIMSDLMSTAVKTFKSHYLMSISQKSADTDRTLVIQSASPRSTYQVVTPHIESPGSSTPSPASTESQSIPELPSLSPPTSSSMRSSKLSSRGSFIGYSRQSSSSGGRRTAKTYNIPATASPSAFTRPQINDVKKPNDKVPTIPRNPFKLRGAAKKILERQKMKMTALAKKRLSFLDNKLIGDMSDEERDLVLSIFAAAKPEEDSHITVAGLSNLLTTTLGRRVSIAHSRKIMQQVDVDGDGQLCFLDLLSVFYLTELYFKALAGGFRERNLSQHSLSFTSSHALLFIALSELCGMLSLKLPDARNMFVRSTSCQPTHGDGYVSQYELPKPEYNPALYCLGLLGQTNMWLDKISVKLVEPTRIKLSDIKEKWHPAEYALPVYNKTGTRYVLPVLERLSRYPKQPIMIKRNSVLMHPPVPSVYVKGSSFDFDSHMVYSNAGIAPFFRKRATQYGIESRSHTAADIMSLSEVKLLADQTMIMAQLFFESSLFESHKIREIANVFKVNNVKMWAKGPLPPLNSRVVAGGRDRLGEDRDRLGEDRERLGEDRGLQRKFKDTPHGLYSVLETLRDRMIDERADSTDTNRLSSAESLEKAGDIMCMGGSGSESTSPDTNSSFHFDPNIPSELRPLVVNPPQRVTCLQEKSYSESGSSCGARSSPYSQPPEYDGASHSLKLLADQASFASALDLSYRQPYPQTNGAYHHGSGASNFVHETDAFSKSYPLGIPPKQGYGHAYNHHDQWQSSLQQKHYPTNGDYDPTCRRMKNFDDAVEDDEESLLIVDSDSSWSDDDRDLEEDDTEPQLPTVIESDGESPPTKFWKLDPSLDSFWQYRKQPKGPRPKALNVAVSSRAENPHSPLQYVDPAFDRENPSEISHFGKARVGEGNDITPNPERLKELGQEIDELAQKMARVDDNQKRSKAQFSSRICRLKKIANHEANKIKLDGLEKEREELSLVVRNATKAVDSKISIDQSLTDHIHDLKAQKLKTQVAGRAGEYVDTLLKS